MRDTPITEIWINSHYLWFLRRERVDILYFLRCRVVLDIKYAFEIFSLDQDLEPRLGGTSNIQVSSDPISHDHALFEVKWDGVRTSTGLTAIWSNEDVDSTVLPDREIYGLAARVSRWMTSVWPITARPYG